MSGLGRRNRHSLRRPKQTLADNGATSFLTKPLDERLLVGCLAPAIVTM